MEGVDPFKDPELYSYEEIPLMKRLKRIFRALDLYALPITLRYKMEKKFYTNYGALSSLILIILVIVYVYYSVAVLLQKTKLTQTQTTKISALRPEISGTQVPFSFGYRILDSHGAIFND
jgi:hypothetical protein